MLVQREVKEEEGKVGITMRRAKRKEQEEMVKGKGRANPEHATTQDFAKGAHKAGEVVHEEHATEPV